MLTYLLGPFGEVLLFAIVLGLVAIPVYRFLYILKVAYKEARKKEIEVEKKKKEDT